MPSFESHSHVSERNPVLRGLNRNPHQLCCLISGRSMELSHISVISLGTHPESWGKVYESRIPVLPRVGFALVHSCSPDKRPDFFSFFRSLPKQILLISSESGTSTAISVPFSSLSRWLVRRSTLFCTLRPLQSPFEEDV